MIWFLYDLMLAFAIEQLDLIEQNDPVDMASFRDRLTDEARRNRQRRIRVKFACTIQGEYKKERRETAYRVQGTYGQLRYFYRQFLHLYLAIPRHTTYLIESTNDSSNDNQHDM